MQAGTQPYNKFALQRGQVRPRRMLKQYKTCVRACTPIRNDESGNAYTNLRLKQRKIVPGFFVLARKASESVPIGTVRVADAARAEKTGAR